jgi:hypothetical protein
MELPPRPSGGSASTALALRVASRENGAMLPIRNVLAILLLACPGCAGFRGELLPQLGRNDLTPANRMPAISYTWNSGIPARGLAPNTAFAGSSSEWLFRSAFVDARNAPGANDIHIDLYFQSEMRQPTFSMGLMLLSIFSLGIIPGYACDDLSLRAQLQNQGQIVKEYQYVDSVDTWMHLFMIPWAFSHDPAVVEREALENMLLHLIRDLRKDLPQLAAGAGAPAPAAQPPH